MAESLGSRYVLQEVLGRGAMGQVSAGSIRSTGEPVAIKVLRPELVSDPEVVARFVQERTILMSITDPNVVRVIDLVVEGDTLAIVMELVQGSDLRRLLRARRTVPPAEALHLTGQVLRGMTAVHAAGIVHRDIKPENVLVDTTSGGPRLKLTDFGVARLSYGASLTRLSGVIGTPEYMAPELAEGSRATPAADVYSAGIVLYEMLCGRTPFAGGHPLAVLRRHADQAPPAIPDVPAELWGRIAWMLAKDPRSRPASADEAYAALVPLESSLAAWPALAPWEGPEGGTDSPGTWTPAPSVPGAARAGSQDYGGPAPGATVLRHRDRGEASSSGGVGGLAAPLGAGKDPGRVQTPMTSAPSRRKRQARAAALAVAVVAVLGLVTTVALAATHRTASLTPAARERTTTVKGSVPPTATSAPTGPVGTRTTGADPRALAGGLSGTTASGAGPSGSTVSNGKPQAPTVAPGGNGNGGGTSQTGGGPTQTTTTSTSSTGTSPSYPPLTITTSSLPVGFIHAAYDGAVSATGGNGQYTWTACGLPEGLGIAAGSGAITGTPAGGSTAFTVIVTVTDTESPAKSVSKTFTLTIATGAQPGPPQDLCG